MTVWSVKQYLICIIGLFIVGRVLNLPASRPVGSGPAVGSTVEITAVPVEIAVEFRRSSHFTDVLNHPQSYMPDTYLQYIWRWVSIYIAYCLHLNSNILDLLLHPFPKCFPSRKVLCLFIRRTNSRPRNKVLYKRTLSSVKCMRRARSSIVNAHFAVQIFSLWGCSRPELGESTF
jgi:hypothetical protein